MIRGKKLAHIYYTVFRLVRERVREREQREQSRERGNEGLRDLKAVGSMGFK